MQLPRYFTPGEIRMIVRDFKTLLKSPEAHTITMMYMSTGFGSPVNDPVYHFPVYANSIPVEVKVKCIHKIVSESDVDIIQFRIAKDGDSIFYIYPIIDLTKPDGANEAIPESLKIKDELGLYWIVNIKQTDDAKKYFGMKIGNIDYATIIIANIARAEK